MLCLRGFLDTNMLVSETHNDRVGGRGQREAGMYSGGI